MAIIPVIHNFIGPFRFSYWNHLLEPNFLHSLVMVLIFDGGGGGACVCVCEHWFGHWNKFQVPTANIHWVMNCIFLLGPHHLPRAFTKHQQKNTPNQEIETTRKEEEEIIMEHRWFNPTINYKHTVAGWSFTKRTFGPFYSELKSIFWYFIVLCLIAEPGPEGTGAAQPAPIQPNVYFPIWLVYLIWIRNLFITHSYKSANRLAHPLSVLVCHSHPFICVCVCYIELY